MMYLLSTEFVAITTELDLGFISIVGKYVTECQAQPSGCFPRALPTVEQALG